MTNIDDKQFLNEDFPIHDKLNLETAIIKWKELQIFFAKGKLLVISNDLDLVKVATTVASNNAGELKELIEAKKVAFATVEWVKAHCVEQTDLWAVVVSPYVITQLKSNELS